MMPDFNNKVVVITGAASGIGFATALRFAKMGAIVAGLDVQTVNAEKWRQVTKLSRESAMLECDIRNEQTVSARITEIYQRFDSRLDVLVNSAGVSVVATSDQLSEADWNTVIDINLKGTFLTCKHAAKLMLEKGAGNIVNIASIEGMFGFDMQMVYGSSKAGVAQMTKNMAVDFGRAGIRVNCVCPGVIETPMTALLNEAGLEELKAKYRERHLLNRLGQADEVAAAICFLASDDASFITGHSLVVDGGFTAGQSFMV